MAYRHNKDEDVVAGDDPSAYNNYDSTRLNDTSESDSMDPDSGVKRGLKNRHLSMMALAGIIGPGLLVGAGGALNVGGPAALLIGFGVVGKLPMFVPVRRSWEGFVAQRASSDPIYAQYSWKYHANSHRYHRLLYYAVSW
jgi:amino acid permease